MYTTSQSEDGGLRTLLGVRRRLRGSRGSAVLALWRENTRSGPREGQTTSARCHWPARSDWWRIWTGLTVILGEARADVRGMTRPKQNGRVYVVCI